MRGTCLIFASGLIWLAASAAQADPGTAPLSVTLSGYAVTIVPGGGQDGQFATLSLGTQAIGVPAGLDRGDPDARPDLRALVSVRDDRVFIAADTGGNGRRAQTKMVLAVRQGHLVRLGQILDDQSAPSPQLAAMLRMSGRFIDLNDQLENNGQTAHADAPTILIALHEQDGALRYDPDWCWRLNAGGYKDALSWIDTHERPVVAASLLATLIDTYCGRTGPLAADLSRARLVLPADQYARLAAKIGTVRVDGRSRAPAN